MQSEEAWGRHREGGRGQKAGARQHGEGAGDQRTNTEGVRWVRQEQGRGARQEGAAGPGLPGSRRGCCCRPGA